MPASMLAGLSANGPGPEPAAETPPRRFARKPTPNALTNVATASPAVQRDGGHRDRHGQRVGHAGARAGRRQPVDQRLQQQPLGDERGARRQRRGGQCPQPEGGRGHRQLGAQPAERVQVPGAGGPHDRPGGQEQQRLERRVVGHVQQQRRPAPARPAPVARVGEQPRAPTPISTSPMFSVVELPSSRLRSVLIAACRMPYTAEAAPSPSSSSHHHRAPRRAGRSRPGRCRRRRG